MLGGRLFHWITVRGKKLNLNESVEQYGVWKACKEPGRGLIGRCIIDGRDNATRPSLAYACVFYSGGPRWHQDKEAHGLSSALVNYNNLLCLLTPLSPTYSRLVFKKY